MSKIRDMARTGKVFGSPSDVLRIKKMHENAVLPTRGTDGAAGLDLYAIESYEIGPGDIAAIRTGLAFEIPKNLCGLLATRSSMGKRGVRIAAGMNIIDEDYRGELMIFITNDGIYNWKVEPGDRVAQMVIVPYIKLNPVWADELTDTKRGNGGFGSTGR